MSRFLYEIMQLLTVIYLPFFIKCRLKFNVYNTYFLNLSVVIFFIFSVLSVNENFTKTTTNMLKIIDTIIESL